MRLHVRNLLAAVALPLFIAVHATAALAGGSVSLEDVVRTVAGQSPVLMKEIHQALRKDGKTISAVVCDGVRLGRHWKHLGGLRIPTFTCPIAGRKLIIEAETTFFDETGATTDAPGLAAYSVSYSPKWKWQ